MQHRVQTILTGFGAASEGTAAIAMRVKDRSLLAAAEVPLATGFAFAGRIQPGSALKPFILVAALEQGFSLSSKFLSEEATLRFPDGTLWHVRNNNNEYLGWIDLAEALARSDNVVFARLMQNMHADGVRRVLGRFDLGTSRITPAVSLGAMSPGLSPAALLNAYATLASGGVHRSVSYISGVVDRNGGQREPFNRDWHRATSQRIAAAVSKALASAAPAILLGGGVGAKTGTALHDQVVCAFREDIAALVWIGRRHGAHEIDKGLAPTQLLAQLASTIFSNAE
jgi:penicillin-binding protein 1A